MEMTYLYSDQKANPGIIWLLFLFFGWSYGSLNEGWKQFFYYITFGGFGFWTLYRLFTLNSAIRKYNKQIAISLGMSHDDLLRLGLLK